MLKKPIKAAAIAMTAAMMMNFISPAGEFLPELPLKTSAAEKFNVPKNGDGIREMTVKHVRQMATVEWNKYRKDRRDNRGSLRTQRQACLSDLL